jgi:hypothetical protein
VSGGTSTNEWVFTPSNFVGSSLALGTTFGPGGNYNLECNCGTYNVTRTYSATLSYTGESSSSPTATPEPGTALLLLPGLMGLAVVVRRKRAV